MRDEGSIRFKFGNVNVRDGDTERGFRGVLTRKGNESTGQFSVHNQTRQ